MTSNRGQNIKSSKQEKIKIVCTSVYVLRKVLITGILKFITVLSDRKDYESFPNQIFVAVLSLGVKGLKFCQCDASSSLSYTKKWPLVGFAFTHMWWY